MREFSHLLLCKFCERFLWRKMANYKVVAGCASVGRERKRAMAMALLPSVSLRSPSNSLPLISPSLPLHYSCFLETVNLSRPACRSQTCSEMFSSLNLGALSPGKKSRKSAFSAGRFPGKCRAALEALVFDCDGVILESEDLHRRAYNAAFQHFAVCCPASPEPIVWTSEFYDVLQNQIGGGKPKMRWYFNKNGWPSSTISTTRPESELDQATLIDTLQDWKTEKYKDIIRSGTVEPRPGVLRLMDEARALGLKLAVCSAATKSSVVFCLTNLLGTERFEKLDCFLAGDDVDKKKPDPSIYIAAAIALGVAPERSLVVEDSIIGLQAAVGAGMSCIISYTSSTRNQDFGAAKAVYPDLGLVSITNLVELVEGMPATL